MQKEEKVEYIRFPYDRQGRENKRERERVEHLVSPDYPNVSRYVSTLTFSIRRIKRQRRIQHCKTTRQAELHRSVFGQVIRNIYDIGAHDDIVAVIAIVAAATFY